MAFGVSANPTSFTLDPGGSQQVVFTFTGVPAEVAGQVTVVIQLGAESTTTVIPITLEEPDPIIGVITTPPGVTATVLSVDDTQATIQFAR